MKRFALLAIAFSLYMYCGCTIIINPSSGGLQISPKSYNFGDVYVGKTGQIDFRIMNNFADKAQLSFIELRGDNVDDFEIVAGDITPANIAGNAEYIITVRFSPKRKGQRSTQIHIEYNTMGGEINCQLQGRGVTASGFEIDPASYDFGNVAIRARVEAVFSITNVGNIDLVISTIEIYSDLKDNFSITEGATAGFDIVVEPNQTHEFKIEFYSIEEGSRTAKFRIIHNADNSPYEGNLTAYGSTEVSLSPMSHDFDEVELNHSSKAFTFTVSNPFSSAITVTGINIIGVSAAFKASPSGSGSWQVAANGGILTIEVTFKPTNEGLHNAQLQIIQTKGTLSANLSGTGIAIPKFSIEPKDHNFGTIEVNVVKTIKFKIINPGTGILRLNTVQIQNDYEANFTILTGNSGTSINPLATAYVEIRFHPQSLGMKNAILRIDHNADGTPFQGNLSGLAATVSLTPSLHNFGNVGINTVPAEFHVFQVVNATSASIMINFIDIDGPDESSFAVSPSGSGNWPVAPGGGSFNLTVTCCPKKSGSLIGLLKVTYQGGQLASDLQANGIAMPVFDISPEMYNFGTVTMTSSRTNDFTIRNTGNSELTINDISIINDTKNSFSITFGGLTGGSTSVPVSSSRVIRVMFEPKAFGACSATLHIEHNANGSPFNGQLTGSGTGAFLTLIPDITSYNFGEQFIGHSSEIAFYLQNSGNANLTITNVSLSNYSHYLIEYDSLPILLTPGKISIVKVKFSPYDTGYQNCNLNITHTSVLSPRSIAMTGRGKLYSYYLNETFEGSAAPTNWWASTYGDWEWGRPQNVGPSHAFSGSRCFGTRISDNYSANQNCVLVTPKINLNNATYPILRFYMWLNSQSNYDGGWVEISTDDGGTWTQLQSPAPAYNSSIYTTTSQVNAWSGDWSSSDWTPVTIDLTSYAGESQVRLLWHFYSNNRTNAPGLYVDNASIFEDIGPDCPKNPVPVVNDISVPVIGGSFKLKWECDEGLTFDVYLSETYPPESKIGNGIGSKNINVSVVADKTYYWKVIAHNSHRSTISPIWYFKTVSGTPKLLINEVDTTNPNDYIEFYNTESYMVFIGKWQMTAYANSDLQGTYEFPEYTIIYPGEIFVLYDYYGPSQARFKTTFNIVWTSIYSPGEIIWQYPQDYGSIGVDYMRFNVVVPNNMPSDMSWSGLLVASYSTDLNWYRRRTTDYNNADDWRSRRQTADQGAKNPGQ